MAGQGELSYRSKSDLVADAIRGLIERGEFKPGHLLRQRELATRFGVSPTPVREALRRLEAEGYVISELHRGATVVRTAAARIQENFLIRATLEGLATELAAGKITDEDLDELAGINDDLATCAHDESKRFELNRRFHFRIYEAAGSPILTSLLNLLWRNLNDGPGGTAAPSTTRSPSTASSSRRCRPGTPSLPVSASASTSRAASSTTPARPTGYLSRTWAGRGPCGPGSSEPSPG